MNPSIEICKAFNRQAKTYEKAAKVQTEIGERLFERLDYLTINPRVVLDLGCGPGGFTAKLKKKYPKATIVGLDLAYDMLQEAQRKQGFWRKWPLVNADMTALPFAKGVFDLVFSNQVIHWSEDLSLVFGELNRVMSKEGCLMFSTLGPDSFIELKNAWATVDNYLHVNDFMDMHDIGDSLLKKGFVDPVVDMEKLTVHYKGLAPLLHGLKAQGVRNINPLRQSGLTGKRRWQAFEKAYETCCTEEGKYPMTYEVVYGHAWNGVQKQITEAGVTFVPISQIVKE